MAKKKLQYPNRKRNNIIVFAVCCLVVLGAILAFALYNLSMSNIMTFKGQKVSVGLYNIFLSRQKNFITNVTGSSDWLTNEIDGVDYKKTAKENAVNALLYSLNSKEKAKELGISLKEEDLAKARELAVKTKEIYKENFSQLGASDSDLEEFSQNAVFEELAFKEVTKDFAVDEQEITKAYDEYLVNNVKEYKPININYVLTDTEENAKKAKEEYEAGKDAKEVEKAYSLSYNEANTSEFISTKDAGLTEDVLNKIHELKAGQVSDVLPIASGFFVAKVHSIVEPDMETVKANFVESFTSNKKNAFFEAEIEKLKEANKHTLNQKAYDKVDLALIP